MVETDSNPQMELFLLTPVKELIELHDRNLKLIENLKLAEMRCEMLWDGQETAHEQNLIWYVTFDGY